jgi:hypothetical protein
MPLPGDARVGGSGLRFLGDNGGMPLNIAEAIMPKPTSYATTVKVEMEGGKAQDGQSPRCAGRHITGPPAHRKGIVTEWCLPPRAIPGRATGCSRS